MQGDATVRGRRARYRHRQRPENTQTNHLGGRISSGGRERTACHAMPCHAMPFAEKKKELSRPRSHPSVECRLKVALLSREMGCHSHQRSRVPSPAKGVAATRQRCQPHGGPLVASTYGKYDSRWKAVDNVSRGVHKIRRTRVAATLSLLLRRSSNQSYAMVAGILFPSNRLKSISCRAKTRDWLSRRMCFSPSLRVELQPRTWRACHPVDHATRPHVEVALSQEDQQPLAGAGVQEAMGPVAARHGEHGSGQQPREGGLEGGQAQYMTDFSAPAITPRHQGSSRATQNYSTREDLSNRGMILGT